MGEVARRGCTLSYQGTSGAGPYEPEQQNQAGVCGAPFPFLALSASA